LSVVENIIQRVMASPVLVQDEPRLLLHDHFTQPRLYASVLAQAAQGSHSPKEIATAIDSEPGTVGSYLNTLVRLGLLQRETPVTERHPEQSRRSRYTVRDPFLRFYYRFLAPQLPFLVRGAYQAVWQTIEQHWRAFIGTHTFEELCREWVYVAAEIGKLPFLPQVVGSHWSKTEQIDVVAINWDQAAVLYGECKWRRATALELSEVEKLVEHSDQIGLETRSGNPLRSYYVFFSRAGFTPAALTRISELNALAVDLPALDSVLAQAVR
jgi:AAA+ ATPase superfamily predicted ATPase